MKILIVTPRVPYPPYRGDKLKIYNISKQLLKHNQVTILTFYRNSSHLKDAEELKKTGADVKLVKLTLAESFFRILLAFFSNIPFQVAWYKSSGMKDRVKEEVNLGKYDVVYYHLIRSSQYLYNDNKNKPFNVLDFTDAVSLYLKRFAEAEKNIFKKFMVRVEEKRVAVYEKVAEKFNAVFICSDVDRKFLLDRGLKANIRLLKNGLDTDYFSWQNSDYDRNRIIFTGNMPYFANYDAVLYFCKEIFPLIIRQNHDARFYIVGQNPPQKILALASKNIIVTGFVPDIKAEYLKSAVNIAPMRFGAGTLNKVIESISLGVPIVATSMAIGGLPGELKKYVIVADDCHSFAEKVCEVMINPGIRNEVMKEGQEVVKELLSWEKIVGEFENYLSQSIKN